MKFRFMRCAATVFLLLPAAAQEQEWVVDDVAGSGVDFTTVQAAFDAAAQDDVILVKPGSYNGSFLVDAKSLVIAADVPGTVEFWADPASIRNLGPSQSLQARRRAA